LGTSLSVRHQARVSRNSGVELDRHLFKHYDLNTCVLPERTHGRSLWEETRDSQDEPARRHAGREYRRACRKLVNTLMRSDAEFLHGRFLHWELAEEFDTLVTWNPAGNTSP